MKSALRVVGLLGCICGFAVAQQPKSNVQPIDVLRNWQSQNQNAKIVETGPKLLWLDMEQPEVLYIVGSAMEKVNRKAEAATYLTLYLRTLETGKAVAAEAKKFKPAVERRLAALKADQASLDTIYKTAAATRKFESPQKVSDIWMSQVEADLFSLNGLYAWKMVGGRKDADPKWIHNTQGVLHRSGMKLVDEVEGRKGVLFGVPLKEQKSADADESNRKALGRLGHSSRIIARNILARPVMRIGARAYGFPFILRVKDGEEKLFEQLVNEKEWSDVKVELSNRPVTAKQVTVELIVPEGQKWSEGVWIDYLDFFEN
jgi:hypothetical protein